jgi:ATP-dependent DNA helicase PIF1
MSLDLAQVSLSSAFEHGQAYVALSRCRSLKGLKVLDFNPLTITAHPDALAFHQSL